MNLCHDFRYGKIIYNNLDMYVGKSLKCYGEYCQGEADIFEMLVHTGNCVVEVGANIGSHTVHLAQLVGPSGVVWAFEPQRLVFQILAGNMAINSLYNVYCEQKCVSDVPGTVKVPVFDTEKLNNWGGMPLEHTTEGEPVETITLDSLNLPRCDFLKIDVEGMELQVLRGGEKLINTFHPVIYAEADREDKKHGLFSWLHSHNYRIYSHNPPLYNPNNYFGNPEHVFMDGPDKEVKSMNVLCLYNDGPFTVQGLEEITEW
ncbi:Methyltransferase FkbM family [Anaerovibrio sp. JC8]|uniref:FkbM family methyltransferase n=1 Tax=Anaerovibrio sp. JC8 TaxID=1240085 RepID=UPI000A0C775F|nr:FkbM family methyltransferase [Anaerovibrio sp. JC8]ORU00128.1 Methyltransferase FkbM family [Anaerovibrio sp. JC8]